MTILPAALYDDPGAIVDPCLWFMDHLRHRRLHPHCDYRGNGGGYHRAIRRLGRPIAAVGGVAQRVDERVRRARALCPRGSRFGRAARRTSAPARAPNDR